MSLLIVMLTVFSTSVIAATNISSFTVTTSTVKKVVGKNAYQFAKTVYYTADVTAYTVSSGTTASYYVIPATNLAALGTNFSQQLLSTDAKDICITKKFTSSYAVNTTLHFYVTGKSGSITNSVTLS